MYVALKASMLIDKCLASVVLCTMGIGWGMSPRQFASYYLYSNGVPLVLCQIVLGILQ